MFTEPKLFPSIKVCGSAHTLFTPFWASKKPEYLIGDHDVELVSRQVSPRGGLLDLRWNKEWGDQEGMCWLTGEGLSESTPRTWENYSSDTALQFRILDRSIYSYIKSARAARYMIWDIAFLGSLSGIR